MTARTFVLSAVALPLTLASANAQTTNIAGSTLEYSGTQGTNGWTYGYYNRTTDAGGVYSGSEFQLLPSNGSGGYALAGPPPWTTITNNLDGHPNATNSAPNEEHWVVRRYTVGAGEGGGAVDVNWLLRKANPNCGDGVTGYLFHNGNQIDTASIAFSNATGVFRNASIPSVSAGDTIDLMLSPTDPANDSCDGSQFFMDLNRRNTFSGLTTTLIADSIADFGQNTNGWTYGMYDITANGSPGPGEFMAFDASAWNGSAWDINPAASGPWTEVTATSGHPNGVNSGNEHWATRRYTIQPGEGGDTLVEYDLLKANPNGGGTSVHILVNGTEVGSTGVNGWDSLGWDGALLLPNLQVGDTIDLALAPQGTDVQLFGFGDNGDGADGSNFGMRLFHAVPEPSLAVIIALGLGVAGARRRRK